MTACPKICIVTFHKNTNPGSMLQAFAMKSALEAAGCSVSLCKDKSSKHTVLYTIRAALLGFIRTCRLDAASARIRDYSLFAKAHRLLGGIAVREAVEVNFDCYILGSDIIWDLSHKETIKRYRVLFGFPFIEKKVISYAVSAGDATDDDFKRIGIAEGSFNHVQAISVRDAHTKGIIESFSSAPIAITCDPTMLPDPSVYDAFYRAKPEIGRYVALYLFSPLSVKARAELSAFAMQNDLKIVAITKHETRYADVVTSSDPWSFLTYYKYADYVITDTFHGSIFSVILNKQFVAIERGKNKVNDLLTRLELSNRLVRADDDITPTLVNEIDWNVSNRLVADMRAESLRFLTETLGIAVVGDGFARPDVEE